MRIMRLKEVMETTGLGRSSIYKYAQEGSFPKPVSLGGRSSGWVSDEVEEWVVEKIAIRDERLPKETVQAGVH
ncbi:AlpA family transcriptional regulator [Alcanivorax sp.]|uniref:helix-turn-helix transcriptional regulator n=1 Tax=Alcanivorax sp. TaxID=1872427 RepID=UPI0025C23638|nr:AlpA family transcriptional regulator [Alcanivorax sp.]